jgi:hypothetical protein
MTIIFRARGSDLDDIRKDLERPHTFAAERVGLMLCGAGRASGNGLFILLSRYVPLDDDDYVLDRRAPVTIGPSAFRKALQFAYNGGAQNVSIFHVHMHEHIGQPAFSRIDATESRRFVPDFFNTAPNVPHGALILSRDRAAGLCWRSAAAVPEPISAFRAIGAPLRMWGAT